MGRTNGEIKIKKFTGKMQAKLLLVFCIMIIALTALIGRLVYLNRTDGERYAKRVLSQQTYSSQVIPYQRGDILDRKGTVLATSEKVYNVILDVNNMLQKEEYLNPTIKALTSCYKDITEESLMDLVKTNPSGRYNILKKGLNYDEMMLFKNKASKNKKIQGVWFEEDYTRKYPYNTLAGDIIGFTSNGNVGNYGMEQYYNEELNGVNGREYGYMDAELKLEQKVKPAENGNTVVSTIDANVQGIVQNHIKAFRKDPGCLNMGVIVMNPNNGEIIAMASNEEYDLNKPYDLTPFYTKEELEGMNEKEKQDALYAIWRNYAISDDYEPGSTFKPFTVAAGLEENVIQPTSGYLCEGSLEVAGVSKPIKCSHSHGQINLEQALALSCNVALMQIGEKEGRSIFYRYQNFFGFGHKTGIDLPGEALGQLVKEKGLNASELATSSFGQTMTVTMIQEIAGYSSLVNGGYYYEPHIVKQILNDQGTVVKEIDKKLVKETVSRETSEFIKDATLLAVEEGTATKAKPAGYSLGGKTGTAEKLPRGDSRRLVSFIGQVPADKPEVVIYVVIDEPNVEKQDNSYATVMAKQILTEILPFLEMYPTEEIKGNSQAGEPVLPSTENEGDDTAEENTGNGDEAGENPEDGASAENTAE